ncbi:hypothetical protein, partial [Staphylococcus haemolyticus]|uniref:hypothetical protein n=1 Tax=Staphylococcus haemolyticus TaxID=1283 RepID=UPI002ACE8C38
TNLLENHQYLSFNISLSKILRLNKKTIKNFNIYFCGFEGLKKILMLSLNFPTLSKKYCVAIFNYYL